MNVTLTDGAAAVQLDLSDYQDLGESGLRVVVQNLGPGDVYFDAADDVDDTSGVKIASGGNWEFVVDRLSFGQYFYADGGDADVRFTAVG